MRSGTIAAPGANLTLDVSNLRKEVATMRRTRFRGLRRIGLFFTYAVAADNLVCLPKLLSA